MSADTILSAWKKNVFKPVYWLQGDEDFFIDEIMDYAESSILSEADASFNLSVFYGRDADWTEIVNACRRYPMFADRQLVLLKEAQHMKEIDKLDSYISNPLSSTIFVVSYRGKLDGRLKLSKTVKDRAELFQSKKVYDNQLPQWVADYIKKQGFQIAPKALNLLVDHIGNDLSRIANEVKKVSLNLSDKTTITEDDIEKYIGVSKEFNMFELQHALSFKDQAKAIRIIQYFEANPKLAPVQLVIPSLYTYFAKVLEVRQIPSPNDQVIRSHFYNNFSLVPQVRQALTNYSYHQLEGIILLLHAYNLKTVGIHKPPNTEDGSLMKELIYKIVHA